MTCVEGIKTQINKDTPIKWRLQGKANKIGAKTQNEKQKIKVNEWLNIFNMPNPCFAITAHSVWKDQCNLFQFYKSNPKCVGYICALLLPFSPLNPNYRMYERMQCESDLTHLLFIWIDIS